MPKNLYTYEQLSWYQFGKLFVILGTHVQDVNHQNLLIWNNLHHRLHRQWQ